MIGVYIGRLNPMHLGHEATIKKMISEYGSNCLLILGSSNEKQTLRHLFNYEDRRDFVKHIFPGLQIVGLPDYELNSTWFAALDDILDLLGEEISTIELFAGCMEDIQLILDEYPDTSYQLVDRIDGPAPGVSATKVRDHLLKGHTVDGLINVKLFTLLRQRFELRWKEFIKK